MSSALDAILHRERHSFTLRQCGLIHKIGGHHVLHRMPHRLVDRDLFRRPTPWTDTENDLAQFGPALGITAFQFRAADRRRLKRVVAFDEEMPAIEQGGVELAARRIETDRGTWAPGAIQSARTGGSWALVQRHTISASRTASSALFATRAWVATAATRAALATEGDHTRMSMTSRTSGIRCAWATPCTPPPMIASEETSPAAPAVARTAPLRPPSAAP